MELQEHKIIHELDYPYLIAIPLSQTNWKDLVVNIVRGYCDENKLNYPDKYDNRMRVFENAVLSPKRTITIAFYTKPKAEDEVYVECLEYMFKQQNYV